MLSDLVQLAIIRHISRQVSSSSAGDYQAEEHAGIARSTGVGCHCLLPITGIGKRKTNSVSYSYKRERTQKLILYILHIDNLYMGIINMESVCNLNKEITNSKV